MTRYGMAIDLRRCAGCGACVVACQMQNNQRPGVSWNNLDVYEWGTQAGESGRAYVPNACVQCEKPACVDACPTGASVRRDDGITVIDYEKCIACGLCLAACPYGARKLNRTSENMFGADVPAPYESYGVQRSRVVEKCIFCRERAEEGLPVACVLNCPAHARFFGDLDDPESDVSKRIAQGDAVRVDETSFYYVPMNGMDESLLPTAAGGAYAESSKAAPGIDPVAATIGVAAVAAVGVGVGVGVKKAKAQAKADEAKSE